MDRDRVLRETTRWIRDWVIDLELCPFAGAPFADGRVRLVVSEAETPAALCSDLEDELELLRASPSEEVETTLLLHPRVLLDFADYNRFLDVVDDVLARASVIGEIQVASFHPHYRFAGSEPDDLTNYTNRSPYPMLHLIREDSITRAVAAHGNPEGIPDRNRQRLLELGEEGLGPILAKCGVPGAWDE